MSHRVFDEMARLRRRLDAIEIEIGIILSETVIDLADLRDLRNTHGILLDQLAAKESSLHDDN